MNGLRKTSYVRQLAGIVILLLYIGIPILLLIGAKQSLTIFESPEGRDLMIKEVETAKGFEFPDALRELALREMKYQMVFPVAATPFLLLPLLIWGLRFLIGPDHFLWSWQQNQINRHPIIAYLFLVFSIGASYRFFQRTLNPMNKAQMAVLQGGTGGETGYLVGILICLAISLWLYIGKMNPTLGSNEKTEARVE
jgi:hypothetical protein